jgi:hypothetical protein
MRKKQKENRLLIKKTAFGALFSACACALLLIGGLIEVLDMTSAAIASLAVLVTYLEFGFATAMSVYAASSILSFIIYPVSTANIYYIFLIGYFPIIKLVLDKKLKNHKLLRIVSKLLIFNAGCAAIVFLFVKLTGVDRVLAEFTMGPITPGFVIIFVFALLNLFLALYDKMIFLLSVIYIKALSKRLFPKG